MDEIRIQGIEVFAHHGVLPHERELGQRFVIDVTLSIDLSDAARTDDLAATVDYGELSANIARLVTDEPYDLIETVADRVAALCLREDRVMQAEVTVHKPSAPLPVVAEEVSVTLRRGRA